MIRSISSRSFHPQRRRFVHTMVPPAAWQGECVSFTHLEDLSHESLTCDTLSHRDAQRFPFRVQESNSVTEGTQVKDQRIAHEKNAIGLFRGD